MFGQSEESYRLLVEAMPGMVWLARPDGFIEYFNPRALDYLGLPAEEVGGWGWRKLVHPDDGPQVQAAWDRAVQSGAPYEAEYRMRRNDGVYRWQVARGLPARGPDGQAQKWVGTCGEIHDQKRVEAMALQETLQENHAEEDRARLVAIVESSDDAIIGKTLQGIITSWNEGAQRLFGYTAEEMVGQPVSRLIPADRLDEETDILARLHRGERVKHFETVRRRKDGRLVDVSLSTSPIRDASGRIVGASKIARDVSGRKQTEEALRESRARFEGIIDSAMDAIISIDETQRVVLFNAAAGRMFRCAAGEALGQPLDRFIPARLRTAHAAHVRAFAETGVTSRTIGKLGNLTGLRADGEEFPIEAAISRVTVGGAKLFTVILRDITERKESEAAIQHASEQLREQAAVLELAPVLVRDLDSRIVLWTRGAERLYGFSKEEALGHISHELFQTEFPESRAYVDEKLRRVGQWEGELLHRKRDGERLVVASQQIVYHDGSGRPVRILEANADITERQRAEAELSHSQEQLRALAARLHRAREEEAIRIARELHDQLGRCLTTMKMDVGWIERELLSGEVVSESARALRERTRGIGQAIDETVHIVRRISAELRPGVLDDLGLAAAIEWQTQDFQKRSGVACALRLPEEDLRVSRDQSTALFRIFQESLTNVVRHAQATKLWVNLGEEHGAIVLEVEDNGVGISPAQLAERCSLGLLGMRERAEAFGGAVEIAGVPGKGTTVIARMPVMGINDENLDR